MIQTRYLSVVQTASAGEKDQFAALYDEHCHTVYNHCFRRIGSWSLAEDLTAATFLTAWRRRKHLPADPDGVLPWLLAVANNVLRNSRRGQRRYAVALARLPRPEPAADPAEQVAARVDAERRMAALLPALDQLPTREREVIELCSGSGLTHEQAAQALQIPVGTVKSRLARGLHRLREQLPQTPGKE